MMSLRASKTIGALAIREQRLGWVALVACAGNSRMLCISGSGRAFIAQNEEHVQSLPAGIQEVDRFEIGINATDQEGV